MHRSKAILRYTLWWAAQKGQRQRRYSALTSEKSLGNPAVILQNHLALLSAIGGEADGLTWPRTSTTAGGSYSVLRPDEVSLLLTPISLATANESTPATTTTAHTVTLPSMLSAKENGSEAPQHHSQLSGLFAGLTFILRAASAIDQLLFMDIVSTAAHVCASG